MHGGHAGQERDAVVLQLVVGGRRIAETQEDAAEQASPRVRLVVDPPRAEG